MDRSVEDAAKQAGITPEQGRAFLAAMREPTAKMEEAGYPVVDKAWQAGGPSAPFGGEELSSPAIMVVPANPRELWRAMIDAAIDG